MAKKKQKKEKEKFEYSNEIIGVLLILLSLIGMLGYGRAGTFVRGFAVFLVGLGYFPLLLALLALGVYLIVKREAPKMISRRSIGIYLIVIASLVLLHLTYVKKIEPSELMIETFHNVMLSFKTADVIKNCGGGMLGAVLSFLFNWAFSTDGIIIVVITLMILGIILIFNTSILKLISKLKMPKLKKETEEVEEEAEEELPDKRIVISSIEELTNKKEETDSDIPIKKPTEEPSNESNEINAGEAPQENLNYKLPSINLLKTVNM